MKLIHLIVLLLSGSFVHAEMLFSLDHLLGEYQLIKNNQIYTTTVKEQSLSGILWGSLGPEQWGATGNFHLLLQGSYQWGTLQSYEYDHEEFRFATTLSCVLYTPDGLYHDVWGSSKDMWDYEEGTFSFLLDFTRGFSVWPPAFSDLFYDEIIISLHHDRTLSWGDIITVPPVMTITEAVLIIPEPASWVLLGFGGFLMWRRRKNKALGYL